MHTVDAVVVGAGHNGLVAATLLAEAGWDVLVLEATAEVGGAVRTAELTLPGFRHDVFSAFYPLAVASPVMRALDLGSYGLRWAHTPHVVAHPMGEAAVVLDRDREQTAASLASFHAADGPTWLRMCQEWDRIGRFVVEALLAPFPPARPAARLARTLSPGAGLRLARRAVVPLTRWAEEEFAGQGAPALLAGCAMHTDLGPGEAGSALFGWILAMLGQEHGFPFPVGGAGQLAEALAARATAAGACLRTSSPVVDVQIAGGRAVGVRTVDGQVVRVRRAVLADVGAPILYGSLIAQSAQPPGLRAAMRRFEWELPAVKVDWALSGPIPWRSPAIAGAGTVHLGGNLHELVRTAQALRRGERSARVYAVLGQMGIADETRSPAGTQTAWAYAHLPAGHHDDADVISDAVAELEAAVETEAPGFGEAVVGRSVFDPAAMAVLNPNLPRGAMNGGTASVHQQLVFRPVPGLGRADTVFERLFLASSSAHPGGGVHGACGANAARAALAANGRAGAPYRAAMKRMHRRLLRD
ncbi:MAG: phytoene desaturase family protein [Sporichthyaceae bacterium]